MTRRVTSAAYRGGYRATGALDHHKVGSGLGKEGYRAGQAFRAVSLSCYATLLAGWRRIGIIRGLVVPCDQHGPRTPILQVGDGHC